MMLTWWFFHSVAVAAEAMVIPRSRSRSMKSITVVPSSMLPILCVIPVKNNTRSLTVVLPASMWAINPMFRIFVRSIFEATVVAIRVKSVLSGRIAGGVDDPPELMPV